MISFRQLKNLLVEEDIFSLEEGMLQDLHKAYASGDKPKDTVEAVVNLAYAHSDHANAHFYKNKKAIEDRVRQHNLKQVILDREAATANRTAGLILPTESPRQATHLKAAKDHESRAKICLDTLFTK